jgi:hypothetical protein
MNRDEPFDQLTRDQAKVRGVVEARGLELELHSAVGQLLLCGRLAMLRLVLLGAALQDPATQALQGPPQGFRYDPRALLFAQSQVSPRPTRPSITRFHAPRPDHGPMPRRSCIPSRTHSAIRRPTAKV